MNITDAGLTVLQHYESCELEAYPDPRTKGDPWTIGWGCTGPDIVEGLTITQDEADELLADRLATEFVPGVRRCLGRMPLDYQFSAMVCLAYNIGLNAFGRSTLARFFNDGKPATQIADQFLRWDEANGQSMKGLRRRRAAERALFLGSSAMQACRIGDAVE